MRPKTEWKALVIGLLTAFLLGCQSGSQQTPNETATVTPEASKPTRQAAAKAAPREARVTVPAGTELSVRLTDTIDSGKITEGATFEGTLASALVANGVDVAPVGSSVAGKVTGVVSSGRLSKPAELSLVLTSLTPSGGSAVPISTDTWGAKGKSHKTRDIEMIGGGAAAGTLIGALTGGKKGAAIGAAVGAGGGTGVAAATGKKEIVLAPETPLNFRLSQSASFSVRK